MVHLYPSTKDYIAFSAVPRRRRAGGLTLLELAIVIMLVGFLSLLLVDQQTRTLQERAAQARQDQVVAHATAILEAALNFHEDMMENWPTGAPQTVRTGLLAGYLPGDISNPYSPRPGLSEDFTLEAQPNMLPTDRLMELRFQVWGESDARYVAGLLPFGTATQVGTSDVWDITTQVIETSRARYLRRDGENTAERLIFETDISAITQDRTMPDGVQGIVGVDRITFDTSAAARTDANPNSILGADRVIHQEDESADMTGIELEDGEASLLLHIDGDVSNRLRFDRRLAPGGARGRLTFLQEPDGGGTPRETAVFSSNGIQLPDPFSLIEIGDNSIINLGSGGEFQVDGAPIHARICNLEQQLTTSGAVSMDTYDASVCP